MRSAGSRAANAPGDPRLKNPITGIVGCCAGAARGLARRVIAMRRRTHYAAGGGGGGFGGLGGGGFGGLGGSMGNPFN